MKDLIYDIIATAGLIDSSGAKVLRPLGLTPMTFNILSVLTDGPLSQREIGDRVIVAASSITFQMYQLQRRGLIKRRRADARTWRVSLTDEGTSLHARAATQMDALIARLPVSATQAARARAVLLTIRQNLQQLVPEA
jgi:DNA-binding MarR family transcriptional regulator